LSVAEIDAWEETVKGVIERAWEAEIDAWEKTVKGCGGGPECADRRLGDDDSVN
jgi:hypothetical protein